MPIDAEFASLSHKDPFVVCFVRPHSFRWPKFLANCSLIFVISKRITAHSKLIFGAHAKRDEFAAVSRDSQTCQFVSRLVKHLTEKPADLVSFRPISKMTLTVSDHSYLI